MQAMRNKLDAIEVSDRAVAGCLCQIIPSACPFERDLKIRGRILFHIPPLCQLNPLYEQLVGLRFRALCYLASESSEEVKNHGRSSS